MGAKDLIFVFYGYSGDEPGGKVPSFTSGVDHNRSFEIASTTLGVILQKLFPHSEIRVRRAWQKSKVFDALKAADKPIRQVHIMAHGDSTWLSLAYEYDGGKRLKKRVRKFNTMTTLSRDKRAFKQWAEEDAIIAGYFTHSLPASEVSALKQKHLADAGWQIWGCFAGKEKDKFESADPELDDYLKRFALGQRGAEVSGIAVEIAKSLGVTCTAALGTRGVEFWHRENNRIVRNRTSEAAKAPFWMWVGPPSKWVSYDERGKRTTKTIFFQWTWEDGDLRPGSPPDWFTDAYR